MENDIHRIRYVLKARACSGVNAKPDKSAENYIACGRGNATTDNLTRDWNLLRKETRLLKCSDKLFVLFDRKGTWRYAS